MTFVITQNCCSDASCVAECPVDCIRPTPEDRAAFVAAEMLYIDPDSCIDCGACKEACPVGAVSAEDDLHPHLSRFLEFNAGYFLTHPLEPVGFGGRKLRPNQDNGELAVAVVGAGPSGSYVVEELIDRGNVRVTLYDVLPTPWGLLRSGVAPDHQHTKGLAALFERAAARAPVTLRLNTGVGTDVTIADLLDSHHAVVLATGAADPQPWSVPGAELSGVHPATDFVGWYNGHPDYVGLNFDLSCETAVIVGNGNVALDMARVLLMTPDELNATDIADHALAALSRSNVREVVVLGRRGPLQAAYTTAEFHALAYMVGVDVVVDASEAQLDEVSAAVLAAGAATYAEKLKVQLAAEYAATSPTDSPRRLVFRYLREPAEVLGETSVTGVELAVNRLAADGERVVAQRTGASETVEAGLVLTSVGYRGRPVPGVAFDEQRGVLPNQDGRALDEKGQPRAGVYTTGWIRRGAQGGLGSSRLDASEVADHIVEDFNAGGLSSPTTSVPISDHSVDLEGWAAIDAQERSAGRAVGRPRVKLTTTAELLTVAGGSQLS